MVKILGLLLVSLLPISTSGQRIGIDICSCAPSEYEFEFDFDLACPPVNITQGDAVASTACLTSPVEDEQLEELESKYHAAIQEREDDTEQHVVAVKKAYKEEERKLMARMQEMKGRMEDMERNAGKVRGAGSSR